MGEIFLACDRNADSSARLFVVKLLRPELATDTAFVEMLTDEANVVRNLSHQNIVGFRDFDERDGHYYLVLDYVHGGTLDNLLGIHKRQAQKLDLAVALHILKSLCSALSYAHNAKNEAGESYNLVHRDVTPSNLLISSQGEVKLTDFGLVRAKGRMTETMPGIMKGSFGYMAPEVMTYQEIDCRADIFALGIIGFELFCNSKPTEDHSVADYLSVIESKSFPKPSQLNPNVPPQLDAIILKALESDREARWQSAREMLEQLEQLIALWKTSWPDVDSGKSRLSALVKHVIRGADEPAVSDAEIATLQRAASSSDMLSEGVISPRAVSSPEPMDADQTFVRSISSPELQSALSEMVAAPRPMRAASVAVSAPAVQVEDEYEDGEDEIEETDETLIGPTDESEVIAFGETRIEETVEKSLGDAETHEQIKIEPTASSQELLTNRAATFREQLSSTELKLKGWNIKFQSRKFSLSTGDVISSVIRPAGALGVGFYEVSDQSQPVGLITVQAVSIVDSCLAQSANVSAGMNWANHLLSSKLGSSRFSSLYLQIDPERGRLEYCNIGYPPGFFYMSSRDELFAMTGREAGLGRESVAEGVAQSITPASGDTLVILSRGVIEAKNRDGKPYGWEQAQACLTSNIHSSSEELLKALDTSVEQHAAPNAAGDLDRTIAVFKKL